MLAAINPCYLLKEIKMWPSKTRLSGQFVTLEPLTQAHTQPLQDALAKEPMPPAWYAHVPTAQSISTYITAALTNEQQKQIAYAVKLNTSKTLVGSTRFYAIDKTHRRALIGFTWYLPSVRRSAVNTECKLLLLTHLFEENQAIAAEFRTHFFNQTSRTAIERLGAKQDGILRNHQILADGSYRDTVVYSITEHEWPAVKQNLQSKLKYHL